ncbi:hypothetical protein [Micromonospora fluostatini]|uniref:hypothetical protein n=1 Tax=Micromonospora sp. JCM 30529 TaxID=3421643 RepID=UPI003D1636BF
MTDNNDRQRRPGARPEDGTDWAALGRRLQDIRAHLIYEGGLHRYDDGHHAEALRRLLTSPNSGWISLAEHERLLDLRTGADRRNLHEANRRAREARARYVATSRAVRAELARWLRRVTNDRTVPSRYRREGVLLAADWLDPTTPTALYPTERNTDTSDASTRSAPSPAAAIPLTVRAAGEREGHLAVGWWRQHALDGHPPTEQARIAATVLAGIDSGDDRVLATLPRFDVAGYDADRFHTHAPHDTPRWTDLSDRDRAVLIDAARDGFTDAVRDGVAAYCQALLTTGGECGGVR